MERLISMTDFVLNEGLNPFQSDVDAWIKTHRYAEFLSRSLELGMFVPCDENGNPLKFPVNNGKFKNDELCEYERAKERVLFNHKLSFHKVEELLKNYKNLEDLTKHNSLAPLKLSINAKNQIGL